MENPRFFSFLPREFKKFLELFVFIAPPPFFRIAHLLIYIGIKNYLWIISICYFYSVFTHTTH